jgi:hypothetical protein
MLEPTRHSSSVLAPIDVADDANNALLTHPERDSVRMVFHSARFI